MNLNRSWPPPSRGLGRGFGTATSRLQIRPSGTHGMAQGLLSRIHLDEIPPNGPRAGWPALGSDVGRPTTCRLHVARRRTSCLPRRPRARVGRRLKERGADRMSSETRLLVIVRRGATERFESLNTRLAGEPVQISWDRRVVNRRQTRQRMRIERRQGDRRGPPPLTWSAGGSSSRDSRSSRSTCQSELTQPVRLAAGSVPRRSAVLPRPVALATLRRLPAMLRPSVT